jgi:hypothetical protein
MCLDLFSRHYSARQYKDGQSRKLFCGSGQKIVLRTLQADAMFVWRRFIDDSGQEGVNCAVFRNESSYLSSDLIKQADLIAELIWPNERHYTFVNQKKIRSSNPGACFRAAGWQSCGVTQKGLLVLEKRYNPRPADTAFVENWNRVCERVHAPEIDDPRPLSEKMHNLLYFAGAIQNRFPDSLRKFCGHLIWEGDYGFSDKDFVR